MQAVASTLLLSRLNLNSLFYLSFSTPLPVSDFLTLLLLYPHSLSLSPSRHLFILQHAFIPHVRYVPFTPHPTNYSYPLNCQLTTYLCTVFLLAPFLVGSISALAIPPYGGEGSGSAPGSGWAPGDGSAPGGGSAPGSGWAPGDGSAPGSGSAPDSGWAPGGGGDTNSGAASGQGGSSGTVVSTADGLLPILNNVLQQASILNNDNIPVAVSVPIPILGTNSGSAVGANNPPKV